MVRTLLLVVVLSGWLAASAVSAATYLVTPDGTGDFPNIDGAVVAAQTGDIIELADGTFQGTGNRDVSFRGKAITVRSQHNDPLLCVIDCQGEAGHQHRAFKFENSEGPGSILEGVTVTHGYSYWGGGIHVIGSNTHPTIRNCIFRENDAGTSEGGGICVESDGWPTVSNCLFVGNTAGYGGGISLTNGWVGNTAIISGCTFYNNHATEGGAGRT
jgi:hypothetical protein